jgi:GDP-4-dehydro-6-deoxy-D-mannose reductase
MKTILVTGSGGFVGKHLLKELSEHSYGIIGIDKVKDASSKNVEVLSVDLMNPKDVAKIDFKKIEAVIHLAGLAAVGPSFDEPMQYITTNMGIQVNLFEEALKQNARPRFLIISSGSIYNPGVKMPLDEKSELLAGSPYAVSKMGQESVAAYYQNRGFECVIARPFNHIGPGQGLGFLIPDIAQQIVESEKGQRDHIELGNLDSKRDYTDVRDIVRAYRLLVEKAKAGETYNVCSGVAVSGNVILETLIKLSKVKIKVENDPARMRPSDAPILYGSNKKLRQHTGWSPEIKLATTLDDVLSDMRNRD